MSDITQTGGVPLYSPADTRAEYEGVGRQDMRIGVEVEYPLTSAARHHQLMNLEENTNLRTAVRDLGTELSEEVTAHVVEMKTDAYKPDEWQGLKAEFNRHYANINAAAEDLSLTLHEVAHIQEASFADIRAQLLPRERGMLFFNHFMQRERYDMARYITSVCGAQFSLSYADEQHGHDLYKRFVFLTPLLATLYANAGQRLKDDCGQCVDLKHNFTLASRLEAYGIEGAVPQSFWEADTARGFFDRLNAELWQQSIFCYFDTDGSFKAVDHDKDIKPFAGYTAERRNTANFQLLSSMQWHLVGIPQLPFKGETGMKRRIEMRALDTLPKDQVLGITRFAAAAAFDSSFGQAVDEFITQCGFDLNRPGQSKALWLESLRAAVHYHPNGCRERMPRFGHLSHESAVAGFTKLLEAYSAQYPEFADILPYQTTPQQAQACCATKAL